MNTKILDKLTFGFEIEGIFSHELRDLAGQWTQDGSVHSLGALVDNLSDRLLDLSDSEHGSEECETCSGTGHFEDDCDCESELVCGMPEHDHNEECRDENDNLTCGMSEHEHSWDRECYTMPCLSDDEYHRQECYDCDGTGLIDGSGTATEYNSPVFQSLPEALSVLTKFNNKTYQWNETCGLHFHVGTKDKADQLKLFSVASNFDFMRQLLNEALTYCPCQRERLEYENRFCKFYQDRRHVAENAKHTSNYGYEDSKYLFCRFHPNLNTLEFRFFRPCEHKVENVKKLVKSLSDYLAAPIEFRKTELAETGTNTKEWKNERVVHVSERYQKAKQKVLDDFESWFLDHLADASYSFDRTNLNTFDELCARKPGALIYKDAYDFEKEQALQRFEARENGKNYVQIPNSPIWGSGVSYTIN